MACPVCGNDESRLFCTAVDRVRKLTAPAWRIERCARCGFGWTAPTPSAEETAAFYPADYFGDIERTVDDYLSGRLRGTRLWRGCTEKARLVERHVKRGRILDVGCGDGKFLWALNRDRWDATGIDTHRATLSLVRARIPSLRLIEGDLYSAELSEGAFDVLTLWHVFEHLANPAANLRRIRALLSPGGWLFISLPRFDSLQASIFRRHWYAFDDVPRHLYHFSKPSLDRLLRDAGFEVRRHLPFSRLVNFHTLKHSLLNWCEDRFSTRLAYYSMKPSLFPFVLLERLVDRYGILTTVAQKPRPRLQDTRV